MPAPAPTTPGHRAGLAAGLAAYALWGALPLYFPLLAPSGPVEIIAHRVVWSLLFCLLLLAVTRTWEAFVTILRDHALLARLTLAAVLLAVNWLVFVHGVTTGHVVDAALGYFINPLVTIGLAVLVLGERLRAVQWVAVGCGALAVVVLTVGYGRLPWIALVLAGSFGTYGLIKSRVGPRVTALPGLAAETAVLAPVALGYLVWLHLAGVGTLELDWHGLALVGTGVLTAVPLLLFNSAARRLPLSTVGLLQYLAPVLQLAIGVLVAGERMPPARWWGFGLVWVALAVLTVDGLRHSRRPHPRDDAADA
ncbi:EamA family transporter RarD [Cellulomonas wangsupingiae]|uniref:EamA family transporter RarD n=1 Tax=Cellulomonas wangsupingiae TaxID=2968085 RepID=UPI001D0E6190|nr:EamA family transporter RarD [Cellulomonas wangsupingiae]MCM0639692.1 EamA family transporter RarD [Cellulomonas wangsupingiae]